MIVICECKSRVEGRGDESGEARDNKPPPSLAENNMARHWRPGKACRPTYGSLRIGNKALMVRSKS